MQPVIHHLIFLTLNLNFYHHQRPHMSSH
ncbi:hypothetical protein B4U79_14981 [Dinothrombium tinctorium]|uniref:Uncharacterized protein n=1 Tax=Dinothrombium tinctorium TaxID=1965070 RepID=A0A443QC56_9ACAR|nr:hypothetical protein B4U79_14981 [Dinothrombium tinctorium]